MCVCVSSADRADGEGDSVDARKVLLSLESPDFFPLFARDCRFNEDDGISLRLADVSLARVRIPWDKS